jgi:TPP-dependent indolepyruvate ferredoxin oxidoreductase alpha subunit
MFIAMERQLGVRMQRPTSAAERDPGGRPEETCSAAEAIARGLLDVGASVVTHVPGHGATAVFEAFRALRGASVHLSFHEEVAFGVAHGASVIGGRSACLFKAHGVAKAANAVVDSLSCGTTGGLVVLVVHDATGATSDSVLDTCALLRGLGLPYRTAAGDPRRAVVEAFLDSERSRLPHALVVDAERVDDVVADSRSADVPAAPAYRRDVAQTYVGPLFAKHQHRVLEAKRAGTDWRAVCPGQLPRVPDDLRADWRDKVEKYERFFAAFRELRGPVVTGDTSIVSLFSLPPYECVDVTTYMGGSVPLAIGAHLAGEGPVWAMTGDFAFLSAGHLGLLEAVQRGVPIRVAIFADGRAEATGGQPVPLALIQRVLRGYAPYVRMIEDPRDTAAVSSAIAEANDADELRILLVDCAS